MKKKNKTLGVTLKKYLKIWRGFAFGWFLNYKKKIIMLEAWSLKIPSFFHHHIELFLYKKC